MPASAVPLRGKLEEHSFPAVLRALLLERRDGCLTVARGAITRRLYLRGGMIVYGSSTERQDRLGEILIAQGKLSKADHKKYWEQSQAGNRLLGITLVLNGRITLNDLYQGVTAQVVTILDRLQKWRKGEYEFEEGREPAAGTVLLRIPLALYLRTDAEKKPAVKRPAAKKAAAKKPAKRKAPLPYGRRVRPTRRSRLPPESPPTRSRCSSFTTMRRARTTIGAGTAREVESIGEVSFMVQELRKRLGQDPFALLGVPPEADRSAVHAAFHRIAKVLHPDRLPPGCAPELAHEAEEVYREVSTAAQSAEEELRRKAEAAPRSGARGGVEFAPGAAAPVRGRPGAALFRAGARVDRQAQLLAGGGRPAAGGAAQTRRSRSIRQYLGLALMQTKRLHEAEEHLVGGRPPGAEQRRALRQPRPDLPRRAALQEGPRGLRAGAAPRPAQRARARRTRRPARRAAAGPENRSPAAS